jgi:hypothetical protein
MPQLDEYLNKLYCILVKVLESKLIKPPVSSTDLICMETHDKRQRNYDYFKMVC